MSADIERKLLSLMTEQANIAAVWDMGLQPTAFEEPINRLVFEWMIDYWQRAQMKHAPTWMVMETEFPSVRLEPEVEETVDWIVEHLQVRYQINQGQRAIKTAADDLFADPTGALSALWQTSYDITQQVAPRYARADMALTIEQRRERYLRRNESVDIGMTLGLAELDAHTGGILPGELVATAAYTKTGKTWMLANALVSAHKTGQRPLIMTLEQGIPEFEDRVDAIYSGVSFSRLQAGELTFREKAKLNAAQEEMAEAGPLWVEKPQRGDRTIKAMCSRARELGSNYLLIDQLSFIDAERNYTGDRALTAKHTDLIFELKDEINRESAGKIGCHLAVQMNRLAISRNSGGRGALENFANATAIEQTVDLALGLWRTKDMRDEELMGLDIMGSRRCDLKSWKLRWSLTDSTEIRILEENDD